MFLTVDFGGKPTPSVGYALATITGMKPRTTAGIVTLATDQIFGVDIDPESDLVGILWDNGDTPVVYAYEECFIFGEGEPLYRQIRMRI